MNESRREPITGTQCPTLFDKWPRISMPSRTDTAGHTKAFIYPVMEHGRKVKVLWHKAEAYKGVLSTAFQDFIIDVFFRQRWVDERLAFKDEDIPVAPDIPLIVSAKSADKLWVPDLFFPNEKSANYHEVTVTNKVMKIYANGTIRYSAR